jgi:hypothetical protein
MRFSDCDRIACFWFHSKTSWRDQEQAEKTSIQSSTNCLKMKSIFVFFCLINFTICLRSDVNLISSAISQIIEKVYVDDLENFDFIVRGSKTQKLFDIVDQTRKISENPVKVIKVIKSLLKIKIDQSAVLLFDSFQSVLNIKQSLHDSRKKVITIYIEGLTRKTLEIRAKSHLKLILANPQMRNSYFLINDGDFLTLITLVTFQQPNCREWEAIEVNRFSKAERKWKSGKFLLEKFMNYSGCEMIVSTPVNSPPMSKLKFRDGITDKAPHRQRSRCGDYGECCLWGMEFAGKTETKFKFNR